MSPMFKQNVGMTKIYAKGIAELFLIRCNPYHWDGSGEVPDNISFDVYKRKIDETYDGCTLEIQLCKPDGCLCYAASVHLYEGGFWTGHGIVGADQIVQWDTRYGEMTGKDNAICEE